MSYALNVLCKSMMRMNERIKVFLHACEILTVNVYNRLMKVCINYVYINKIKS